MKSDGKNRIRRGNGNGNEETVSGDVSERPGSYFGHANRDYLAATSWRYQRQYEQPVEQYVVHTYLTLHRHCANRACYDSSYYFLHGYYFGLAWYPWRSCYYCAGHFDCADFVNLPDSRTASWVQVPRYDRLCFCPRGFRSTGVRSLHDYHGAESPSQIDPAISGHHPGCRSCCHHARHVFRVDDHGSTLGPLGRPTCLIGVKQPCHGNGGQGNGCESLLATSGRRNSCCDRKRKNWARATRYRRGRMMMGILAHATAGATHLETGNTGYR